MAFFILIVFFVLFEQNKATTGAQRLALRRAFGNRSGDFDEDGFVELYLQTHKTALERRKFIAELFQAADQVCRFQISSLFLK